MTSIPKIDVNVCLDRHKFLQHDPCHAYYTITFPDCPRSIVYRQLDLRKYDLDKAEYILLIQSLKHVIQVFKHLIHRVEITLYSNLRGMERSLKTLSDELIPYCFDLLQIASTFNKIKIIPKT